MCCSLVLRGAGAAAAESDASEAAVAVLVLAVLEATADRVVLDM